MQVLERNPDQKVYFFQNPGIAKIETSAVYYSSYDPYFAAKSTTFRSHIDDDLLPLPATLL